MKIAGYTENIIRIVPGLLCLCIFCGCNQSKGTKRNDDRVAKQLDSLYFDANQLITSSNFEKGIVLVRKGIAEAATEKNDSMLSRFYWMATLYFRYKPAPQRDSQSYYTLLAGKHADLSGNKRVQLSTFYNRLTIFFETQQLDSAISASNRVFALARELKDSITLLDANLVLSYCYRNKGLPEQQFQYLTRTMNIYQAVKYKYNTGDADKESKRVHYIYTNVLYSLADYFYDKNNIIKSLEYYNELDAIIPEKRKSHNPIIYIGKGSCYEKMGATDSANKYFKMAVEKTDTIWYFREHRSSAARHYARLLLANGHSKEGARYLHESLRLASETRKPHVIAESRLALADLLIGEKQWHAARDTLQRTISEMDTAMDKKQKVRAYEMLCQVFKGTGDYRQALQYYTLSKVYQDSINTEQVMRTTTEMDVKYQADKKSQQITLLQKSNRIQELQLLAARRLRLFYALSIAILLILFGLIYYYRRKLQRRNLERVKNDLETKALRAQMKPHFIFNSLNAIQELIVTKDYSRSSQYLARFSRLLRMVLNMADKNFITLQQEIELCHLYVSLESLRLKNSFHYSITVDEKMDTEMIFFPTLLVQPFVENAIWHGLSNKNGDKYLSVHFEEIGDCVRCTICDNGIGRAKSAEIKAAKIGAEHLDSKGIKIAEQRISVLREGLVKEASINIVDLYDGEGRGAGTKVVIDIVSFLTAFNNENTDSR